MMLAPSRTGLIRIAVVAAALALSACASNGLLDELDQAQPVGSDFSKELFKDSYNAPFEVRSDVFTTGANPYPHATPSAGLRGCTPGAPKQ